MCVLVAHSCPTLFKPMDCSSPGSSAHGILQARILGCVAILFCRESSQSRDWTWVSCIAGRCLTIWDTREAHLSICIYLPCGYNISQHCFLMFSNLFLFFFGTKQIKISLFKGISQIFHSNYPKENLNIYVLNFLQKNTSLSNINLKLKMIGILYSSVSQSFFIICSR